MSQSSVNTIEEFFEPPEPLVQIRHLDLVFGRDIVLRDINLSVPAGQTLAILGESGCGKTSLMNTIIGLVKPTRGEVQFDNRDINTLTERQLTQMRLRFGFVFQNAALFDSMSVARNVAFPLRLDRRLKPADVREMVLSRLAEVGLPATIVNKKPSQLSGGEKKRVGLARALIMNPELIMYDEPTTGLDPIMADVINELIIRTRRRNPVTSIVVTHDMTTAGKVADRIVMLMPYEHLEQNENQIIYDGPPSEIDSSRDRRVRQFVNGEAGERLMEMRAGGNGHQ